MRGLPSNLHDDNVLVGYETSDDAGVYRISDELAIIQTVDYFTPIVDDPYMFGQIAAANALSDVYAMGGEPKTALNIVGYPIKKLGPEILNKILAGAYDKVKEAGAVIIGGHSIDDQEPKFGLSVTGFAHPAKLWKNKGAAPGDVLVLTKPIGVGIITTGIKRNKVSENQMNEVTSIMATLNKTAAEHLKEYSPSAVTDVTGFGLLGHTKEMAEGSNVSIHINIDQVPILGGTKLLADEGIIPGGTKANWEWLQDFIFYESTLTITDQLILCDAITSGGLLISMNKTAAKEYVDILQKAGNMYASIIGEVKESTAKMIYVSSFHKV